MNRQNLKQGGGRNPWLAQGCLEGVAAYATEVIQLVKSAAGKDRPSGWSLRQQPAEPTPAA